MTIETLNAPLFQVQLNLPENWQLTDVTSGWCACCMALCGWTAEYSGGTAVGDSGGWIAGTSAPVDSNNR